MEYKELLEIVGDEPVFDTGLLLAGEVDPDNIRRQLSRWTSAGRIYQLRRGLYSLAPPYQSVKPHPFLVANRMVPASYVSLQSALAFYGLIPEAVPNIMSVTAARPNDWQTPLGFYSFRHIKNDYLHGYRHHALAGGQAAFVASPTKALLDLVYLTPGGDDPEYLEGLRLQNLEEIDPSQFIEMAAIFDRPKIERAVETVLTMRSKEMESVRTG